VRTAVLARPEAAVQRIEKLFQGGVITGTISCLLCCSAMCASAILDCTKLALVAASGPCCFMKDSSCSLMVDLFDEAVEGILTLAIRLQTTFSHKAQSGCLQCAVSGPPGLREDAVESN
jgi:hypothetical protein